MTWWLWLACAPDRKDDSAYANALAPVLLENGLLADQLLDLAARAHDEAIDAATLQARWLDDAVPLADRVAIEAAAVSPPASWQADHDALVTVWRGRASALRASAWAVVDGDAAAFDAARARAATAQLDEEAWFRAANARIGRSALSLVPHP
jgi:hypothetical protein